MKKVWRIKHINLQTKLRLYEALMLSTLLCGAEVWPLTVTLSKKLEAADQRWLRGILGITCRERVTNEEVRKRTGQIRLEKVIRERRMRWLCHVARIDEVRIQKQSLHWEVAGFRRMTWQAKDELERCGEEGPPKNGINLERR